MKTMYILKTNTSKFVFADLEVAMKKFYDYEALGLPAKVIKSEVGLLNEKQTVLHCSV